MTIENPEDKLEHALSSAIDTALTECNGIAVKWIALIETFGIDGPSLWRFTSNDLQSWDMQGMLAHATAIVNGQTIKSVLEHDDNGD